MRIRTALLLLICAQLFSFFLEQIRTCSAQEIAIDEQLGEYIPMDLSFTDEYGNQILLKQLTGTPVILSLAYYTCPDICNPFLHGLADVLNKLDAKPGKDYTVLTISFDENDTHAVALQRKQNYIKLLRNSFQTENWKFLTGDKENIHRLTESLGFKFKRKKDGFLHTSSLIVISPSGKIIRYLYGISFLPFDIKMALTEAVEERHGPTIPRVLRYCFSYDPVSRKYVFNVARIGVACTLLAAIIFYLKLIKTRRA